MRKSEYLAGKPMCMGCKRDIPTLGKFCCDCFESTEWYGIDWHDDSKKKALTAE